MGWIAFPEEPNWNCLLRLPPSIADFHSFSWVFLPHWLCHPRWYWRWQALQTQIRWTFLWSNFGRRYIRIVAAVVIKAEDKTDKLFFLLILSTFACYIEETDESFKANFRHLNYSKSSFQGVTLECFLVYPMINRYRKVSNLETDANLFWLSADFRQFWVANPMVTSFKRTLSLEISAGHQ